MNPVRRAVTGLLRWVGAACLLFGLLLGALVIYHCYGPARNLPVGLTVSTLVLLLSGTLIVFKSSAIAAKLTEDIED